MQAPRRVHHHHVELAAKEVQDKGIFKGFVEAVVSCMQLPSLNSLCILEEPLPQGPIWNATCTPTSLQPCSNTLNERW
jgi:hypothetical protein